MTADPARVAVFGAGYVGLVTGACLADLGHTVTLRDVVAEKVRALSRGEVPIFEPGLDELLATNRERIRFTLDVAEAIDGADFVFVCVDTPPTYSGDADLSRVWTVVDELRRLGSRAVVVMKSTVPVGTGEKVRAALDARGLDEVGYVSNPEFTAEGTAVRDFLRPDRIVIGTFDDEHGDAVERLHAGIEAPVVRTDVASAEMVKLASNAFLSTRISFINEIANVCELVGADVEQVAKGIGLDHRLGSHFLRAGIGFGGSCLVGDETVLVRVGGKARLLTLERLYAEASPRDEIEILTWRPDAEGAEFFPVALLTRRQYSGDIVEVRTKMGRRVHCTPDHPFVTDEGRKLAEDLTTEDWLPTAQYRRTTAQSRRPRRLNVIGAFEAAGITPDRVTVRPREGELASVGALAIRESVALLGRPQKATRAEDIVRTNALRLDEAALIDLEIEEASFRTSSKGSYVPATIVADAAFWRVVGLYIAKGHCVVDPRSNHRRLQWCFHPTDENDLMADVVNFWEKLGVRTSVHRAATTTIVAVSSHVLAAWWVGELGLGKDCYEQRLPDLIWDESEEHARALLAGAWRGEGSWSRVNRGPSVVLEYGTVSRELADGVLRLLGDLGIVARLKVGRTSKSTCDTYWLVVSGAAQVERLLDFVSDHDRVKVTSSISRQTKRTAPNGYRRRRNAAWVRVADVTRRRFSGYVYSLEVPPSHTFVTTGGLVCSNCFPKDITALKQLAGNSGYHFQLLSAVIEVNELQKRRVVGKLQKHLGRLRGKSIALLGLAFKPNTDDMREAPSIVLASRLLAEGAEVRGWDPVADAGELLQGATLYETPIEAAAGADAAVVVTEWPQLAEVDWSALRDRMRNPLVIDGRNFLDAATMRSLGFVYEGIGRASGAFAALPETPEREPAS